MRPCIPEAVAVEDENRGDTWTPGPIRAFTGVAAVASLSILCDNPSPRGRPRAGMKVTSSAVDDAEDIGRAAAA